MSIIDIAEDLFVYEHDTTLGDWLMLPQKDYTLIHIGHLKIYFDIANTAFKLFFLINFNKY